MGRRPGCDASERLRSPACDCDRDISCADIGQVLLQLGLAISVFFRGNEGVEVFLHADKHTAQGVRADNGLEDGNLLSVGVVLKLLHVVHVHRLGELADLAPRDTFEQRRLSSAIDIENSTPLVGLDVETSSHKEVVTAIGGLQVKAANIDDLRDLSNALKDALRPR